MKKIVSLAIGFSLFSSLLMTPVNAQELDLIDTEIASTVATTYIDDEGDLVLEETSYNKDGDIIEVSVEKGELSSPADDSNSVQGAGYYAVSKSTVTSRLEAGWKQLRIYANGFSDSYTSKSKSSKKSIDKISVNTTLMMNGSVEDQNSDSRKKSSFANASAKQQRFMFPTAPQYSKSSHTYHNAGANSIYHTTQAKRG